MFKTYLLGGVDPALYGACFVAACVGIFLTLLWGTTLRSTDSNGSPYHFSWKYLWTDNTKRILANIIAVLVSLRFMTELFGWELSVWKGFCIGLSWDVLALIIKQKTTILDPTKKP